MSVFPKIKYHQLILLSIILSSGILGYFSIQAGHDWGGDFALYIHQAKEIVNGDIESLQARNTYAMLNSTPPDPKNPNLRIGPFLYPWGFPLLLAPVFALFGLNLWIMKTYGLLFMLLSLVVVYFLFRQKIGVFASLWIVALFGLSPGLLQMVDVIGSDIPYLLFALLSLLFIQKMLTEQYWNNATVTALLTGIIICVAFLIRTNGIVLLGTLLFSQFLKHKRQLITPVRFLKQYPQEILPYMSFAVGMLVVSLALPSAGGSHLDFLARITPGRLIYNTMYYFKLPADFYHGSLFPEIFYGLFLPFFLLGVYRQSKIDYHYILYCAFSLAIFVFWPPVQGLRFIISLFPFYLYFTVTGFAEAESLYRKTVYYPDKSRLVIVFCAMILIQFLGSATHTAFGNAHTQTPVDGPHTKNSQQVFEYVNQNTSTDAVIVFFKPRVMDLLTQRRSVRIYEYEKILTGNADYLVYNKQQDFGQISPSELLQLRQHLPVLLENESFAVLDLRSL